MTNIRSKLFTLATVVLFAACGGTPTDTGGDDNGGDTGGGGDGGGGTTRVILTNPLFTTDIQEIFGRRGCTASGCHGSLMQGGLDLRTGAAYGNLVGVPAVALNGPVGLDRVTPNDILASYLWLKVSGTTAGTQMPFGGTPLDNIDQTNIMNWINTGALNN